MEVCPVFIDETGVLSGSTRRQPVFGVAALVVPETKDITDALYRRHFNFKSGRMAERRQIRQDIQQQGRNPTLKEIDILMHSTSHHEYKFTEASRFNIQQYIDLLNIYFTFPELRFHAMILDRRAPDYSLDRWHGDVWSAYVHLTRDLLERRLDRSVFAIVDLQGKPSNSSVVLEDVLCAVPQVKGCLRATSDMSVYLQIVDMLLGCIQFDWKDDNGFYDASSKRADDKREMVNFVKSRLGLLPGERFLASGESAREWDAPSLFTVDRGRW